MADFFQLQHVHHSLRQALQCLAERKFPHFIFNRETGYGSYAKSGLTESEGHTVYDLGGPFGYQAALSAVCDFARRAAEDLRKQGVPIDDWRALFAVGAKGEMYLQWELARRDNDWLCLLDECEP